MKNTTIKQLADQGITICLNGGMYEVQKSGKSVTIFKSFNDALEFAGKQIVLGESMVGFNETGEITLDDVIRQLELLPDDGSCDEYTNDCIRFAIKYIKGSIGFDKIADDVNQVYPLPALCYGDCGKVYEHRHLNHIDDPNGDEVLLFCNQCAFQFVANLHSKEKSCSQCSNVLYEDGSCKYCREDEIRESCGEKLD